MGRQEVLELLEEGAEWKGWDIKAGLGDLWRWLDTS